MRQIKNITKHIALTGAILLCSCGDFLDQLPDNRTELSDKESIERLLVSAYPAYSHIMLAETMSDNMADLGPAYTTIYPWYDDFYKWETAVSNAQDGGAAFWSGCYTAIASANHALRAIEQMGDTEELQPHKGEALMCRAYAHFMLVNVFAQHYGLDTSSKGGIPYATEPETTVLVDYERASVSKVYELIEKDLAEGIELISNSLYEVPKYHFTIQAAHAFASRFYLFKGDWEKVITHANKALGSHPENFMRDWKSYDAMSFAEFTEAYTRSTDPANLMMVAAVSWWARVARSNRYGLDSKLRFECYNYFGGKHPWGGGQAVGSSTNINTGTYAMKNVYTLGVDLLFTPKWDEKFKYEYPGSSFGIGYIMQPVFTGEEVLLNRAEAYIMAGEKDLGIADLNFYVNTHCPYPGSIPEYLDEFYTAYPHQEIHPAFEVSEDKKQLIHAVLDIRRREFMHDGMRWFDIKRYNFAIRHTMYSGAELVLAPNDPRRAVQIPQDALNNGISPNPKQKENTTESDYIKVEDQTHGTLPDNL